METLLSFQQLAIGYHKKNELFNELNLELQPGELVCLLGPNGAGKSTLLKTILGLQPPLRGELKLCNRHLNEYSSLERAQTMSAMLTDRIQADHLNVLDLILLGRFPHRKSFSKLSQSDLDLAHHALAEVHAEHLKDRRVDCLSDGERQRVLLSRAMAQDPKLLLLDEPTSFLDYPHKVETFYLLKKWVGLQKRSILMSTHDLDLSLNMADRLIILEPGGQLIEGAPEDLIINGSLARVFHSNLLKLDHQSGRFEIKLETHTPIQLTGEGEVFCWTEKALNRSGYFLADEAKDKITIHDQSWILESNGQRSEHKSLHQLLHVLKLNAVR